MLIEFIRSVAMPRTHCPRPGGRLDVPEDEARSLIAAGHARAVEDPPAKPRRSTSRAVRRGGETRGG